MRLVLTTVLACAALGLLAPAAGANDTVRFGVQDDAWLAYGPGTVASRLERLERLGVDLVRLNLHWNQIEATRGSPDWSRTDAILRGLRARRIDAVVGLVGSPSWANGGKSPNHVPRAVRTPGDERLAVVQRGAARGGEAQVSVDTKLRAQVAAVAVAL